ncbi:MAG: bifunctional metallophosphatase/5'-nucleotidase [Firmicutes bacterium]|nr:bifunctional metallophosphatase/5'-nucleotidase [Bacillota bacterium]
MRQMKKICTLFLCVLLVMNSLPISQLAASGHQQELYFTLLHTNDEHSALLPLPLIDYDPTGKQGASGGFARLASTVKAIRARKQEEAEPVLLVSAGDFLTGSPFAWLALEQQAPELGLMLELGYDAITFGNHEFDYGSEALADYLQAAGYPQAGEQTPIIASNMVIPEEHLLTGVGIRQTHIKELANGLRIGFFGILGKKAAEYTPYAPPITFSDPIEAARAAVAELQAASVDVVIGLSHSGEVEEAALAAAVPGIDIIIGGHTHEALEQPLKVGETIIVQAGTQLSHLGMLEVAFDRVSGQVRLRNQQNGQPYLLPLNATVPYDPPYAQKVDQLAQQLDALLQRMTADRFEKMNQAILHTDFPVSDKPELAESAFGNFVTDAMRLVGEQVTGEKVDFAFQANGVIRGGLEPGTLPGREGQVSLFDLVIQVCMGSGPDGRPGYPLVSIYFTGEEVRRILEVAALLPLLM